jgi:hypothetical protein
MKRKMAAAPEAKKYPWKAYFEMHSFFSATDCKILFVTFM